MKRRFHEIYPVEDSYRRFDPRNTAFERSARGETASSYESYRSEAGAVARIQEGKPGFSLLDYVFKDAAFTVGHASRSGRGFMNSGLYSWSPLGAAHKPDRIPRWEASPREASKTLARAARYYGAVGVGFCELDRRWVYSHDMRGREIVFEDVEAWYETEGKVVIPGSHRFVMAMTVPMEFEEMRYAPSALNPTSNMGYSRMAVLAGTVAELIRGLGWHALPCGNDTALSVPIAIQAGLGHVGRHGRLITWERGPMVRICKVLTDLPLEPSPMAPGGIIEFCEVCKKCARDCPSGAIALGGRDYSGFSEANNPGALKWYVDADECLRYWGEVGTGCAICFRVCPFTKPDKVSHRLVKWLIRHIPSLNRLWAWSDDALGYGEQADPREYWK